MAHNEQSKKHRLVLVAKVAVAATLVWLIAHNVDWADTWRQFRAAGWMLVGIMFSIMLANVFISAFKWRLLLRIHHVLYPLSTLSKYYFVAMFLNNFLPTSIGGDGYRIYKTFDNERGKASAVVAVLMERLTGIGALVVLGLLASLVLASGMPQELSLVMLTVGAGAVVGPPFAWALRPHLPQKLQGIADTLAEHADDYVEQPGLASAVLIISVAFHLLLTFAYYAVINFGADFEAGMLQLLVVLSVSNLVAVLPISINGIGVFEGTFMYLLGQYGVPYDVSVIPMILNRVLLVPISAIGAAVYLSSSEAGRNARSASSA